jgi:[citrate (pro-3S)-lyase] ligase
MITRTAKPHDMEAVKQLLEQNGLTYETDVERTVIIEDDSGIIATASIAAKLIKCVAIDEPERGRDLTALLLTALISERKDKGQNQFFLFTKPELAQYFAPLGFYKIAAGNRALLMEYSRTDFQDYLGNLRQLAVKAERVTVFWLNTERPIATSFISLFYQTKRPFLAEKNDLTW